MGDPRTSGRCSGELLGVNIPFIFYAHVLPYSRLMREGMRAASIFFSVMPG